MSTMQELLDGHVTDRVDAVGRSATTPAAVVVASRQGAETERAVAGHRRLLPHPEPCQIDTFFDLASLTKLYTATLVAVAVERDLVRWDQPMFDIVEGWDRGHPATLRDVVEHVSGLPAWEKFYEELPLNPTAPQAEAARRAVIGKILRRDLGPVGVHLYSDLGYILLGSLLEEWFGTGLELLLRDEICAPLGLDDTFYGTLHPDRLSEAASTEWCSRRGRWLTGTVHDENCDVLGGIAGHAGIFGTAQDVLAFGEAMLRIWKGDDGIISNETLRLLWAGEGRPGAHRGGWDTPTGLESSVGRGFPRGSTFGHLGFTGTSLWVETSDEVVAVLLTNRVHPSRENGRIRDLRIAVHERIFTP